MRENTETSAGRQHGVVTPREVAAPLVRDAWDASDGTIADAADLLYARVTADRTFIAANLPEIMKAWCADKIGSFVAGIRLKSWTPPNADPQGRGGRLAGAISHSLLDFPLPGGKRLADADANEVLDGAAFYRELADDMAWKARWLEMVAARVGRKRRVSKVLNEAELRQLQEVSRAQ